MRIIKQLVIMVGILTVSAWGIAAGNSGSIGAPVDKSTNYDRTSTDNTAMDDHSAVNERRQMKKKTLGTRTSRNITEDESTSNVHGGQGSGGSSNSSDSSTSTPR